MTNPTGITVPFGRHRDSDLAEIPSSYLEWMLSCRDMHFAIEHRDLIIETIRANNIAEAQAFEVDYELNASQKSAVDQIDASLLHGSLSMMRLDGGAGYGKSFAVMEVVRRAKLQGVKVQACATSYVASQVLDHQLSRIGVRAGTIASTIRLDKVDVEDQEVYTMTDRTGAALRQLLAYDNLLIVDEWSMVNDEIAVEMMHAAAHCGGKLLVVGDAKQLPPVKQSKPSAFATIEDAVELTEPMRYSKDSDLFVLEQLGRYNPEGVQNGGWQGSAEVSMHPSLDSLVETFVADTKADPREDCRMLFFRRKDVFEMNQKIRAQLFGEDAAERSPVIEDERLMVMATNDVAPRMGEPVRYYSGQTFLVTKVDAAKVEGIHCYLVKFHNNPNAVPVIVNIPGSRGNAEYAEAMSECRKLGKETGNWAPYRKLRQTFLQVGYNYAMTVHRAQGQTVDRVYFAPTMLKGPMHRPLTYVAATRAKKHVHMVQGA